MGGIKGWGRAHGRKERQVQVSRSRNLKEEIEIVAFRCICELAKEAGNQ